MRKIIISILVLISNVCVCADLQDALQTYGMQNYKNAYNQFMQLAEVGNADAFYNLGVMYYKGQFVEQNYQQAYAWMKLANEVDEFFEVTIVEKKLNEIQKVEAEQLFEVLDEQYGIKAFEKKLLPIFNSTDEYIYDKTLPKPLVKVAPIYPKRAAEKGVPGIVIVSYRINHNGKVSDIGVISEYPKKFNLAKAAIGSTKKFKYETWDTSVEGAKQFHYMTNVYKFEIKMPIQQKDKFDRLVASANENNAKAQYALANYINPIYNVIVSSSYNVSNKRNTFEIPKMKIQGNELLLNAALNGNVQAQSYLGMRLLLGRDVEKDKLKGINWLKQAAAGGSEYAEKQLEFLN